jgi:hypothetical protein
MVVRGPKNLAEILQDGDPGIGGGQFGVDLAGEWFCKAVTIQEHRDHS